MTEHIDESKKLSLEEIKKLKARMNLLRGASLFVLCPVFGYFLLLIFTPMQGFLGSWSSFLFAISFLGWYVSHALKFVKAWENAPLFRFGKFITVFKPGLRFVFYPFEKVIFVQMWEREKDTPEQPVDTREGQAKIDIRIFFKVTDAGKFLTAVEDPIGMVAGKAQGDVTTAAGSMTVDELLTKRVDLAESIKSSLDKDVEEWGVVIKQIRFDNIKVPEDVLKAREGLVKAETDAKTIKVNADAQKYRVQAEADAEKYKLTAEAEGKAKEFELKVRALGPEGAKIMGLVLTAAEWGKGEGKFFIDPKTVGIPAIAEILKSLTEGEK